LYDTMLQKINSLGIGDRPKFPAAPHSDLGLDKKTIMEQIAYIR
jgi:hypothetical protein